MAVTPSSPMLPKGMILTKFMAYSSAEVMFNPVSATNNCIDTAGVVILRNCSPCKEAIIWYDECSIRYSNSLLDGKGGRGLAPSCNIRYESYTFLLDPPVIAQPPAPNRPNSDGGGGGNHEDDGNSSKVELLDLAGRRFGNDYNSENLQAEKHANLQDFPSFQLDIILAAIEHFSEKNKLGEGGFGPIYKNFTKFKMNL
ncbi:putative cysteine-rich receptor-like protein kinase 39 [Camellia sinensis]|uniref:putative cysteine-rich receptor-like protein kinase 39 n=1 Tax=Camellia sinensis TaxID=4442 RepID=UPI0010364059|nr:putative cysteine-rich receptor-like protein kinase 39 [Camellia sinensis]